jgi:hypothetical protein
VNVLLFTSESMELVQNALEILPITPKLEPAPAPSDTDKLQQVIVLLDAVSMKSSTMESAAASMDTIQLMESVVNVHGTKSMIKVSVSAEFHVIQNAFSTLANKLVYVYLNTTNLLMELVELAQSTQITTISLNHVFATTVTSRTSASAHLLVMPTKNGLMELVNVKLDII